MKHFPLERLKAARARIASEIVYNPHSRTPPTLWHAITLSIQPIKLGEEAAVPELEKTVDSDIFLAGIVIPPLNWDELAGTFTPEREFGNSSFYVSRVHNPIDITSLTLNHAGGARFTGSADLFFDFEFEGAGYQNASTRISFAGPYAEMRFAIPIWNKPEEVRFPEEWRIPAQWTDETLHELFSRFIDLGRYQPMVREGSHAIPPSQDRLTQRPFPDATCGCGPAKGVGGTPPEERACPRQVGFQSSRVPPDAARTANRAKCAAAAREWPGRAGGRPVRALPNSPARGRRLVGTRPRGDGRHLQGSRHEPRQTRRPQDHQRAVS